MAAGILRIPQLSGFFCGCCSLEFSTKFIAVTEAIGYLTLYFYELIGMFYALQGWLKEGIYYGFRDVLPVMILMDLFYLFKCLFAFFLLAGVCKVKPHYVLTWVIVRTILVILSMFSVIVYSILWIFGPFHPTMIPEFVTSVIESYFILIVYSYYRLMSTKTTTSETV